MVIVHKNCLQSDTQDLSIYLNFQMATKSRQEKGKSMNNFQFIVKNIVDELEVGFLK